MSTPSVDEKSPLLPNDRIEPIEPIEPKKKEKERVESLPVRKISHEALTQSASAPFTPYAATQKLLGEHGGFLGRIKFATARVFSLFGVTLFASERAQITEERHIADRQVLERVATDASQVQQGPKGLILADNLVGAPQLSAQQILPYKEWVARNQDNLRNQEAQPLESHYRANGLEAKATFKAFRPPDGEGRLEADKVVPTAVQSTHLKNLYQGTVEVNGRVEGPVMLRTAVIDTTQKAEDFEKAIRQAARGQGHDSRRPIRVISNQLNSYEVGHEAQMIRNQHRVLSAVNVNSASSEGGAIEIAHINTPTNGFYNVNRWLKELPLFPDRLADFLFKGEKKSHDQNLSALGLFCKWFREDTISQSVQNQATLGELKTALGNSRNEIRALETRSLNDLVNYYVQNKTEFGEALKELLIKQGQNPALLGDIEEFKQDRVEELKQQTAQLESKIQNLEEKIHIQMDLNGRFGTINEKRVAIDILDRKRMILKDVLKATDKEFVEKLNRARPELADRDMDALINRLERSEGKDRERTIKAIKKGIQGRLLTIKNERAQLRDALKNDLTAVYEGLTPIDFDPAHRQKVRLLKKLIGNQLKLGGPGFSRNQELLIVKSLASEFNGGGSLISAENCKSGLDRTGMSSAAQTALHQLYALYPDKKEIIHRMVLNWDVLSTRGVEETGKLAEERGMVEEFRRIYCANLIKIGLPITFRSTWLLGLKWKAGLQPQLVPLNFLPASVQVARPPKDYTVPATRVAGTLLENPTIDPIRMGEITLVALRPQDHEDPVPNQIVPTNEATTHIANLYVEPNVLFTRSASLNSYQSLVDLAKVARLAQMPGEKPARILTRQLDQDSRKVEIQRAMVARLNLQAAEKTEMAHLSGFQGTQGTENNLRGLALLGKWLQEDVENSPGIVELANIQEECRTLDKVEDRLLLFKVARSHLPDLSALPMPTQVDLHLLELIEKNVGGTPLFKAIQKYKRDPLDSSLQDKLIEEIDKAVNSAEKEKKECMKELKSSFEHVYEGIRVDNYREEDRFKARLFKNLIGKALGKETFDSASENLMVAALTSELHVVTNVNGMKGTREIGFSHARTLALKTLLAAVQGDQKEELQKMVATGVLFQDPSQLYKEQKELQNAFNRLVKEIYAQEGTIDKNSRAKQVRDDVTLVKYDEKGEAIKTSEEADNLLIHLSGHRGD